MLQSLHIKQLLHVSGVLLIPILVELHIGTVMGWNFHYYLFYSNGFGNSIIFTSFAAVVVLYPGHSEFQLFSSPLVQYNGKYQFIGHTYSKPVRVWSGLKERAMF